MRGDGISFETGAGSHETYRAGALVSLLRLHWFIRLRWAITGVALGALVLERVWTPSVARPEGLWWVVGTLGVVNVGWMVLSRIFALRLRATPVDEADAVRTARFFANMQVAIDLLLLTLVLRFTGGVESPMAMFYVFHMAIGSLLLSRFQAVAQGVWATLLYAGLGVGEWRGWIAPHFEFLPWLTCVGYSHQMEYVAIAVAVVGCGVFGTLFFTLRVVGRLDDRERHLRTTLAALRQSQIAVQDIQARRSRFMQTAAHQLKSPLAAIQTLSNLIRDGIVKDGAILETCEKIGRRCRAGIAAVTELLTLARVQDAAPERHVSALSDVGVAVREVCSRREPEAQQAGIEFSWTALAAGDFCARVDWADLVDCLDNLVENAIKYTPHGGRITVGVERRSVNSVVNGVVNGGEGAESKPARAFVAVTVEDTGIGIDPADLESSDGAASVFDAYRRGHQALAAGIPGSGLGLSIVRVVVEQAGGRIQVRSRPQGGTRFAVMFPAETTLPEGLAVRDTRNREIIVETARGGNEAVPRQTVEDRNHAG